MPAMKPNGDARHSRSRPPSHIAEVGDLDALAVEGVDGGFVLWQCAVGADVDEPRLLVLRLEIPMDAAIRNLVLP